MGLAGMCGCAHYQAQPLAPASTAALLDSRRLDDPGLKHFIEVNLGHPLPAWPLPKWNFTTLTLAAFYYQPSLEVARAQWAVSQAGVKTAGARPNPVLSFTPGYDTTTTTLSPWLPIANLDWPLETAGKRSKRIAEAKDAASSAQWDIITTAWQVRGTVRDTLLEWQMAQRRSQLLDRQLSLQQQIVKRLQQRSTAGDLARPELLTAQIALQRAQMDRLDAETKANDAWARLATAMGVSVSALDRIDIAVEESTTVPAAMTAPEARRVALLARSDIRGALADYAAAEDDLRLEIAKQYPDVHVSPGYQFNQGDNQWMLGASIELPVLDQNQGPIGEAAARRQLAAAKFRALQARVIGEIDQAVADYQAARHQLDYGNGLLAAESKQQAAARAQLDAGALDQFDWLAAQMEQSNAALTQLDNAALEQHSRGALEDALQYPLDSFTRDALKQVSAVTNEPAMHP